MDFIKKIIHKQKLKWCCCENGKFFETQIYWLQLAGLYPINYGRFLPEHIRHLSPIMNLIYYTFMEILPFHMVILHFWTIGSNFANGYGIFDMIEVILLTVMYVAIFFITIFFHWNQKIILEIIESICLELKLRSNYGMTYMKITHGFLKAKNQANFWLIMCLTGCVPYATLALFYRRLPLDYCEYPFNPYSDQIFLIIYLLQFFSQAQMSITFGSSSALYMSLITMVCGQYDILSCSIKNLKYSSMILRGDIEKLR